MTKSGPAKPVQRIRCAVYTRKSSQEGLEQEFNSLDAQRESAEAYIASMKHEGWVCLPDRYDDGGFTGGNMDRPAVKNLMADIEAGGVDCVVVYKVDRLSRSLIDFAKLMELFERKRISFVSVTQQFNTTQSMGRLTLNILLSFAQFEREIISERTRDKIAAARRKGKWSGGRSVLGYDVDPITKKLIVNPTEATLVKDIFEMYLDRHSLLDVCRELNARGVTTKAVTPKRGLAYGGRRWDKATVLKVLGNVLYLGRVRYKDESFAGEQPAIVDEQLWTRVQAMLRSNGRSGGTLVRNKHGALLKGLLHCGPCKMGSVGRLAKTVGSSLMKYKYDRLGRQTRAYTLAKVSDADYDDAMIPDSDIVLEENQTIYEATTGNVLATVQLQRHHDRVGSPQGPLDANGDYATDTTWTNLREEDLQTSGYAHARAQITATWYDSLDRPVDTVQFGTHGLNETSGNNNFNRLSGMSSPPARSHVELRTTTTYNKDGTVKEVADPRNIKTAYEYDFAGRQIAVISNATGTFTGSTEDRDHDTFVRYKYFKGLMTHMWVDMQGDEVTGVVPTALSGADANDQITEYVYGTTKGTLGDGSPVESQIATGHLLREAIYPPQESGQYPSDRTVHSAYNALSEQAWTRNQNDTEILTTFDNGGRKAARIVEEVGDGVSGWVRRVTLEYTDRGQVEFVTQYDAVTSGSELNGVLYTYDDWGNVVHIHQDHDSKASYGSGYGVGFDYQLVSPTEGRQRLQRTSMTLPYAYDNGVSMENRVVQYKYEGGESSPTKLDQLVGRVSGFALNGSSNRANYQYLGAGDLVGTTYPEANAGSYRFTVGTNVEYDAFDRFNRVTIDRWVTKDGLPYRLNLSYDRNSNITMAVDPIVINGSSGATLLKPYSTKYKIDGLNRVTEADRGRESSGSIIGDIRLTEEWNLTQTGNWPLSSRKIDSDGNVTDSTVPGVWGMPEFETERNNNNVNEITRYAVTGAKPGLTPPTTTDQKAFHDLGGQMIDDGKDRGFVYDAFGRLVEIRKVTGRDGYDIDTYTVMAEYRYDGLGQRILWHHDFDYDGTAESGEKWIRLVYDDRWRAVAFFHDGDNMDEPKEILVPHNAGFDGRGGSSYIDSYALREFDGTPFIGAFASESDTILETRQYYVQNWRSDIVSLMGTDGVFPGWYKYSAYGQHQWINVADVDDGSGSGFRDGNLDSNDIEAFSKWHESEDLRADMNLSGTVTSEDLDLFLDFYESGNGPPDSRVMYAGYMHDPLDDFVHDNGGEFGLYHVRYRVYSPELGRWTRRDPIGYRAGENLTEYVGSRSMVRVDQFGLFPISPCALVRMPKPTKWVSPSDPPPSCVDTTQAPRRMTNAEAHKCLKGMMDHDPYMKTLVEAANAKCPGGWDLENKVYVDAPDMQGAGETTPSTLRIDLSNPNVFVGWKINCWSLKSTFMHEITHVIDRCAAKNFGQLGCTMQLCLEMRAHEVEGACAHTTDEASRKECLKKWVKFRYEGTEKQRCGKPRPDWGFEEVFNDVWYHCTGAWKDGWFPSLPARPEGWVGPGPNPGDISLTSCN